MKVINISIMIKLLILYVSLLIFLLKADIALPMNKVVSMRLSKK